jgi:ankyrin repeat protein
MEVRVNELGFYFGKEQRALDYLSLACTKGHMETATVLLETGAKTNPPMRSVPSALICTCAQRYTPVVDLLLSHGADPAQHVQLVGEDAFEEDETGNAPCSCFD